MARALVGSEGTCVNIVSATLNLTASPPHRVLTVLGFNDAFLAADAVPLALEHKPIGLEGFDYLLVDFMRRKGLALRDLDSCPKASAFCSSKMGAWSPEEARAKAEAVARASQSWPSPPVAHICSPDEAASVWHVRESALGAMVFVPGEPDRWEGWEDAAVPPERLGDYLRAITALMAEYGYRSPLYGHYGQGCVHMRINFDFRSQEGLRRFREFIERAADVVVSFGGSLSGEHGDGQSRAALLPKMFGPELVEAFREFKAIWDPDNRMNPGKLSDAVRVYDPLENLHYNAEEASMAAHEPEKHFAFAADHGSLERATERCVGVGACRNTKGGVMCPSYRATGEEQHSTRGRARLLWEMLAGALREEGFHSQAVHEALDLCLSCKACKTECPVQVDMAQYKSEFLAQHYKGRLHPLQHYIFGFADRLARFGSLAPALTNAILTGPLTSPLIKRIAGVAARAPTPAPGPEDLPALRTANQPQTSRAPSFRQHLGERVGDHDPEPAGFSPCEARSAPPQVVLWPDTWNNYYHPQSLAAAESVLTQAGFTVEVPTRPHLLRPARSTTSASSAPPAPTSPASSTAWRRKSKPACPSSFSSRAAPASSKTSCRNSSPTIARAQPPAATTSGSSPTGSPQKAPQFAADRLKGKRILIHGHCHHKAVFGGPASEIALLRKAGATVETIQAGCCGMAGPFGFEAAKFEVSKKHRQATACSPPSNPPRPARSSSPTASVAASRSSSSPDDRQFTLLKRWRRESANPEPRLHAQPRSTLACISHKRRISVAQFPNRP